MDGFNKKSRTENSLKSVGVGIFNQIISLVLGFVYRTVFLMLLSREYLGLNGLFTSILSVLSLAELGIGGAIVYRMYAPIAMNDVHKVACVMEFYKKIYRIIALVIAIIGLSLTPFLKYFIKNDAEIPADVNVYVLYLLFLFQTLSSYFFVYRTSIFAADQKGYVLSWGSLINNIVSTAIKLLVLFLTKSFMATIITGIVTALTYNIIISAVATKRYSFVFKIKDKLDKETVKLIKKDTYAMACHKIGGVVIGSTDNILLSAFVGLGVLGIYSNYSLILVSLGGLLGQLFDTFTSSIGSAKINLDDDGYYNTYKRLLFINLWIVSCACIALFVLINPFITVWLGEDMTFGVTVLMAILASYFFSHIRHINISFTMASGLFKRDKWRPLVEALVNLVVSIVLVLKIGVAGIFVGTVVSNVGVVFWRESYLLYKNDFERTKDLWKYYVIVLLFALFTAGMSAGLYYLVRLMANTIPLVIAKFVIVGIIPSACLVLLTFWTKEFRFYFAKVVGAFKKLIHKGGKANAEGQEVNSVETNDENVSDITESDNDNVDNINVGADNDDINTKKDNDDVSKREIL